MRIRILPPGLMIFTGLLGVAATAGSADQDVTKMRKRFDLRETVLRRFFNRNHCPTVDYSSTFLAESDANGLDWRLLPSISFVESGAGKHAPGNNLFGWNNGLTSFASIAESIHHVAWALSHGVAYRGKTLESKLEIFNPEPVWKSTVLRVMNQISPGSLAHAEQ